MEGQLIPLTQLPSKGKPYPKDIEIYVQPLVIKDQMDMDRYGVSQAEYYQILLNGITVRGAFDKADLFYFLAKLLYKRVKEKKIAYEKNRNY